MDNVISRLFERLELGDPKSDQGLTLVPVFGSFTGLPEFVTLGQALAAQTLIVTEVSEGGSVSALKARNCGSVGVLIIDGEELAGAKQNRVLNTSVYIKPGQEIIIPVSCTEAGRWDYRTSEFVDSGYVSAPAIRLAANESVTSSLRRSQGFHSDQGRIWTEVGLLQERHQVRSSTSAAREVYEQRRADVERREAAFECRPGQIGILALWLGRVAGMDVVTSPEAYSRLHARLVHSYTIDAPSGAASSVEDDRKTAREWVASLAGVKVTEHESPGNGLSYRYTGDGVVGSALAVDGAVLHAVAFATQTAPKREEHYPGFFERRDRFPW
jgi:hypothetical protein